MKAHRLLILALPLLLGGCVDEAGVAPATQLQEESFDVAPRLVISYPESSARVAVDRVFLGIGDVILEPLDDLQAPILSNRSAQPIDLALGGDQPFVVALDAVGGVQPGRYLVSLAIEPMSEDLNRRDEGESRYSISLDGNYLSTSRRFINEPIASPEPVPWDPSPELQNASWEKFGYGRISEVPFSYRSRRTGFVRLGEVELSAEHNELVIIIDLEAWVNEALSPLITEMMSSPEPIPLMDLSVRLESMGLGMEKLFNMSSAQAR